MYQGRIQDFKLMGGALKKIAPSGGRRENVGGISCEKSRFYAKKSYFFQLRREARKCWGISCEKSRFYPKNHIFFNFRGARAGCAPDNHKLYINDDAVDVDPPRLNRIQYIFERDE